MLPHCLWMDFPERIHHLLSPDFDSRGLKLTEGGFGISALEHNNR